MFATIRKNSNRFTNKKENTEYRAVLMLFPENPMEEACCRLNASSCSLAQRNLAAPFACTVLEGDTFDSAPLLGACLLGMSGQEPGCFRGTRHWLAARRCAGL